MSASSPWIEEPSTGRFYVNWKNEYGEIERRYSEELSGGQSSNPLTYRQDYQNQTPRSESSTRGDDTTSRYSTSQRPRRESVSSSRTTEPVSDYVGRSQPLKIYNESRSTYHRPGGYDERDVRVRERHDSPPLSESSQTSRRHQVSSRAYDRDRDTIHDEVDDLSIGVGKVTMDDVVGSPRYTVSASAPAPSGQWGHVTARRESTRAPTYEEERVSDRVLVMKSPVQEPSDDYRDKGKTVVPSIPEAPALVPTGKRHIAGTEGDVEPLDDSYKVRNYDWQKFFRPGRVFSTLWTDAFAGTTNDSENNQFMSNVSYVIYKERVHSKIRRFIVVRLGDRCCTCLPVTTYDGRGSRKRGINLSEHGLIYSSEKKPASVKGIEKLPLKVRLSKGAERLNNPSYVNYGRVYTVETNVKVKDVGELDSESRKYLRAYYNQVNTLPDDDYDATGPARNPQARAVELAGVGGGIVGPPYSNFSGPTTSTYGPLGPTISMRSNYGTSGVQDRSSTYNQYAGNSWAPAGPQYPPQGMHSGFPLYNSAGSAAPTTVRYSAAPTFETSMTTRSTSSNHPPQDNRFTPSDNRYAPADNRYAQNSSTLANTSNYPSALDSYGGSESRPPHRPVPTTSYSSGTLHTTSGPYPRRESDDRREERPIGQQYDDRRPPFESRDSRDSYSSGITPMDRQQSWTATQAPSSRLEPAYVEPSFADPSYVERSIDLPTLEEAQASRRRRESVSDRSSGRERDERGDRHRRRR